MIGEKEKGISGLVNLGNTCFVNACLQILSHTPEFNQLLDSKIKKNKVVDSILLNEWTALRDILWKNNCIVSPGKFIGTVQKISQIKKMDVFTGYQQNDLPEFLIFIMDCFHNALKREVEITIHGNIEHDIDKMAVLCFQMIQNMYSKEYSEIWKLFYGIQVNQILSLHDKKKVFSNKPEPFFILNLSIPCQKKERITLYDCFDEYVKGEVMEGENAWFNEKTGKKQSVLKKIQFWNFPDILVIDLKRCISNVKNMECIDFPMENLNLCPYVNGYKKNTFIYDLYGVANHFGNTRGGHYTSFVKTKSGTWFHFNDTQIQPIQDTRQIISPQAYCLFYRKHS
jgi:ubiquitin carboxyl-terminal hydrolase 8